jgi:copper transport protein
MPPRFSALFGSVAVFVLIAGLAPLLAEAHAVLLDSAPKANQQLEQSPPELRLDFNEGVGPVFFKVLDLQGKEAGRPGEIRIDGKSLFLPLNEALPNGTYAVTYRVISADTHPVGGTFAFSIGEPVAAAAAAAPPGGAASQWAIPTLINRAVLYGAVLLAVGSALLLLLLTLPDAAANTARRHGRFAAIVALLAFLVAVVFGGADIIAGDSRALLSAAAWRAGWQSTLGTSALLGVAGAALAIWAFRVAAAWALWASAALLVASFLVTGHAATAAPVWLMATNVALHLAGAGFWFAAFAPLIATTRAGSALDAARVMEQFSSRALWLVGLLLASGVVVAWVQVRALENFMTTDYGRQLLVKLALVAVLAAIAAYNKFKLTPALARGDANSSNQMARSIRIETVLMVLVVALAASLTLPTPPRALADQAMASTAMTGTGGFRETWSAEGYAVEVEVTPAKPGENMVMLRFKNTAGESVTMTAASIEVSLPAAGLEGILKDGEPMPPDMFHFMFPELMIPGDWQFRVSGFVDDFTKVDFEGKVPVK